MENLPVSYEDKLAARAQRATQIERPVGNTIGTRAGILKYAGKEIPGNKLDCIIIASTHANLYYTGAFDEDNLKSPDCYAYGDDEATMVPHASVVNPQHDNCKDCPKNQWKSNPNGKGGKACKNSRHLALVPADTTDVPNAELAVIKLPVMSVANWSTYVNKLSTLFKRDPLGMVTQIGSQPDAKSQFKITFLQVGPVANELIDDLIAREPSALELLRREYDANPEPVEGVGTAPKKGSKY